VVSKKTTKMIIQKKKRTDKRKGRRTKGSEKIKTNGSAKESGGAS